jgi:glyoxylase-like metal-dependent hydrolase (beta-lactamase superfamily II)
MGSLPHSLLPPGIVVLERGWLSSNNVVLRGAEEAAVVDSGYWTHGEQTTGLVMAATEGLPVRTLVNTHLHSDHCGGNAALQDRLPQLQTLIPPGLSEAVRHWDPVALTYEPTGQHCPQFRIDGVLSAGSSIRLGERDWQVHAAPGHDPHSVVLFEPVSRTLISADALWENGFGVVFPELEGDHAFAEVGATLARIEALAPLVVIPGHGPVFADVGTALERARSRLDAFVANPARHATHAAKVLLKFRLLEVQRVNLSDFLAWAERTRYFQLVRQRWFPEIGTSQWTKSLIDDLVRSGAAARENAQIVNA